MNGNDLIRSRPKVCKVTVHTVRLPLALLVVHWLLVVLSPHFMDGIVREERREIIDRRELVEKQKREERYNRV